MKCDARDVRNTRKIAHNLIQCIIFSAACAVNNPGWPIGRRREVRNDVMHRLRLEITSDPIHLAPVRHKVEAFATSAGFDEMAVCDIGLCLNEAMANVTRHAYDGATDKPVLIEAEFENDLLEIRMRDWGKGLDPSSVPPKKDPLIPGGLGLVCLRSLMDEMIFTKQPDGMLLTMRRRRGGEKPGARS